MPDPAARSSAAGMSCFRLCLEASAEAQEKAGLGPRGSRNWAWKAMEHRLAR